jgi:hypothetical protein
MRHAVPRTGRRGITVLGLALVIIAVIVGVVMLLRYYPV